METRVITIVHTVNQKKSVIETNATTLAELKRDLATHNINYEGMTFYEGLSKTELRSDDSILPHDIERNGTITNNLVFMLTNSEKKIKSGAMSRAEAYEFIKNNHLREQVKKVFGKNFTLCKTEDLVSFVESNTPKKEEKECKCTCTEYKDEKARRAIIKLAKTVHENSPYFDYLDLQGVLDCIEGDENGQYDTISANTLKSPYSDEELEEMMQDM